MIVKTKKLGLAAYMKMKGVEFTGLQGKMFCFKSERTAQDWGIEYMNSDCSTHDNELVQLRKLLHTKQP